MAFKTPLTSNAGLDVFEDPQKDKTYVLQLMSQEVYQKIIQHL